MQRAASQRWHAIILPGCCYVDVLTETARPVRGAPPACRISTVATAGARARAEGDYFLTRRCDDKQSYENAMTTLRSSFKVFAPGRETDALLSLAERPETGWVAFPEPLAFFPGLGKRIKRREMSPRSRTDKSRGGIPRLMRRAKPG
jgi:hypothetical protein